MTQPSSSPDGHSGIALIWAQARNGVIGAGGGLPWHLPEDLALFRRLTTGATVVMGRRTWESLPERFRPLPGRVNVVLTSDPTWSAEGARRAGSVEQVLAEHGSCWVIGGGAVYAAFLPHADRLVVTDVDTAVPGDTWAPSLDGWTRTARTPAEGWSESAPAGLRYALSEYRRPAVGGTGSAGTAR
ncbi:dihydrofolate reductase [Blastococcus montanus]|uniref:dihydrofolate reductase n=1 Tax=Blastococcus montanus TaxID=3144973 RepID=UPI00320854EF